MLLTGIGDRKTERVLLPLATDLPVTSEGDADASNKPVSQGAYKAYVSSVATPGSGENQGNSNVNNNNGNQDNACDSDNSGCYGSRDSSVQQSMIAQPTQQRNAPSTLHETSQTNTEISVRDDKVINQCDADEAEFYRDFYCDDDVTQWSTPGAWVGDALDSCSDDEDCLPDQDYQLHFCQQQSQCYWRVLCRSHDNVNTSAHLSFEYNANVNNNAGGAGEQVPDDAAPESQAVTVMVYGDKDVAGPIELNNGDVDMFTAGKLDEFDVSGGRLFIMPLTM